METQILPKKTIGIVKTAKNRKLIENLEKQGNEIVLFPEPETDFLKIETNLLSKIYDFDWLIFTDLNAVDFFLGLLEENDFSFFELDRLRICALGEAVSDRLRFRQIHSDVIPADIRAQTVVSALANYIFDESEFSRLKFLIIKEANQLSELSGLLSEKNGFVSEMPVYRSVFPDQSQIPKLKAIVLGGGIDEFVFTAPEDVFSVARLFGSGNLAEIFAEIKIAASDEITLQTFNENK
jgi:uroporphyrinogen III methyltransferase / synthase